MEIHAYVTGYEKMDQFFKKIEFLAWIDSSMCAESSGASFMKNIHHKWSYDHFMHLGRYIHFSTIIDEISVKNYMYNN